MRLRSLLFVPGDRPDRFAKAAASGADAVILDLEDSVAPGRKPFARDAVAQWLRQPRTVAAFVRINPLAEAEADHDLASLAAAPLDGVVLPKAEGAACVEALLRRANLGATPILPIATETPAAVFRLDEYSRVGARLAGLTWGAEDLPAAIGASASREPDGRYTAPYEMVRSLLLFGAHAAGVPAIETVFPLIDAPDALADYAARGRRDGFSGMMAIHPAQVQIINQAFTPTRDEILHAEAVVGAFEANPTAGALQLRGRMIDRPHLLQAQRLLQSVSEAVAPKN